MLSLTQSSAPAVEPVTVDMAKEHLRVTFDDDNTYIRNLVRAARQRVEESSGRQLITATWTYTLDCWPASGEILLPWSPLQSVTSIKYVDTGGTQQTEAGTVYDVDITTIVPRIFLKYGQSWSTTRGHTNDIEIIFVAGYGDAVSDVPEVARQAILLMVSHWYEHREPVVTGTIVARIPETLEAMLTTFEVPMVA